MCHLLKFGGLFHTKLFCLWGKPPQIFPYKTNQHYEFSNVQTFQSSTWFRNVSSVSNIYFQNSSPQKKSCSTKWLAKNPHVIPRYPSWRLWLMCSGYQSLDTSVKPLAVTHDTSRRNPSLNNGGNPPERRKLGVPKDWRESSTCCSVR